jgi:hypothetical protein
MCLSFAIAAGLRQRNHSHVRVLRVWWLYFTVSVSRLPQLGGPIFVFISSRSGVNIVRCIKAQRLARLGHLERIREERTTKKITRWKPLSSRPKIKWEDVLQDLQITKIKIWGKCVRRKKQWKEIAEQAKTHFRFTKLMGFRTSSIVRNLKNWKIKTRRFGNWICSRPQVRGDTYSVGFLRKS